MKNYRPLLFENIDLSVSGLKVSCLRLNRHTPEAKPEPHQHHDHGQILIYLSGSGWQEIDGQRTEARSGTVIYVDPGQVHAFERQRTRRPLCLVIDIALDPDRPMPRSVTRLNATELTRIRARLSSLFGLRPFDPATMVLQLGAVILEVLDPCLAGLGYLGETRPAPPPAHVTRKVERALAGIDRENEECNLRDLAKRLGYQQDYLNRQLKAESGLTLGQLRARFRLEKAQRLLHDRTRSIADVAEAIGLLDNNYFARWFKQQTGLTPSAWRAG